MAGEMALAGEPTLYGSSGDEIPIKALLFADDRIISTDPSWAIRPLSVQLSPTGSFTAVSEKILATGQSGTASVTVRLLGGQPPVECSARVTNLGAPSGTGLLVLDGQTGMPIEGAATAWRLGLDGDEVSWSAPTDASGLTRLEPAAGHSSPIELSVFSAGHDHLTVQFKARPSTFIVPLGPRSQVPLNAVMAGTIGFESYAEPPSGQWLTVFAGASISPPHLALFGEDLLTQDGRKDCRWETGDLCFEIQDRNFRYYGPLARNQVFPHAEKLTFLATGQPGVRVPWALGTGRWGASALSWALTIYEVATCACDADPLCNFDGASHCPCDLDCHQNSDPRGFLQLDRFLAESMSAGSGVGPPLALREAVPAGDLEELASRPIADLPPSIPVLDPLQMLRPLASFSEVAVPPTPRDPLSTSATVLEDTLVLTGTMVPGAGFVPLGFGSGFACDSLAIDDPSGCPPDKPTDETVRSAFWCRDLAGLQTEGSACFLAYPDRVCPNHLPEERTDNQVVLQYASPHDGLEGQPEVVMAIAFPHREFSTDLPYRGAGLIAHRAPRATYDDAFANVNYPNFPTFPDTIPVDGYPLESDETFDLHWVVFGDDPDDLAAVRWVVFVPSDEPRILRFPTPPNGMPNPFAGDTLVVRHTGLRLREGVTLETLLRDGGLAPGRLFDYVEGWATRRTVLAR